MSTNFNQAAGVHTRDKKFIFGCGDGAIELADTVTLPHQFKSKWYLIISDCSIRK